MNDNKISIKAIFGLLGCLCLFSIPIIGIMAIWSFNFDIIKADIDSMLNPTYSQGDQNFIIPSGEDTLLTSSVIEQGKKESIKPRSNPATFMIIEDADIEGPIVYGHEGEELLKTGFWNHPASVYPGEKGNSVIFGHRRYNLPPSKETFYNLDKVKLGDRVEIKLKDGSWLEYTVTSKDIIDPENLHELINEQTDKYIVKFVTCHPLGTSDKRLVITAEKTF